MTPRMTGTKEFDLTYPFTAMAIQIPHTIESTKRLPVGFNILPCMSVLDVSAIFVWVDNQTANMDVPVTFPRYIMSSWRGDFRNSMLQTFPVKRLNRKINTAISPMENRKAPMVLSAEDK